MQLLGEPCPFEVDLNLSNSNCCLLRYIHIYHVSYYSNNSLLFERYKSVHASWRWQDLIIHLWKHTWAVSIWAHFILILRKTSMMTSSSSEDLTSGFYDDEPTYWFSCFSPFLSLFGKCTCASGQSYYDKVRGFSLLLGEGARPKWCTR